MQVTVHMCTTGSLVQDVLELGLNKVARTVQGIHSERQGVIHLPCVRCRRALNVPLASQVYSLHCCCNLVQAKFKHVLFRKCLKLPPLHLAGSID